MGSAEIEAFLTHLAVQEQVAASTQNQALNALLFLHHNVLKLDVAQVNPCGIFKAAYHRNYSPPSLQGMTKTSPW
jgi:hypothetical protein